MKRYAFISDIHGNSFALSAVLNDIERRGIGTTYNLGDSLFGPLDPSKVRVSIHAPRAGGDRV